MRKSYLLFFLTAISLFLYGCQDIEDLAPSLENIKCEDYNNLSPDQAKIICDRDKYCQWIDQNCIEINKKSNSDNNLDKVTKTATTDVQLQKQVQSENKETNTQDSKTSSETGTNSVQTVTSNVTTTTTLPINVTTTTIPSNTTTTTTSSTTTTTTTSSTTTSTTTSSTTTTTLLTTSCGDGICDVSESCYQDCNAENVTAYVTQSGSDTIITLSFISTDTVSLDAQLNFNHNELSASYQNLKSWMYAFNPDNGKIACADSTAVGSGNFGKYTLSPSEGVSGTKYADFNLTDRGVEVSPGNTYNKEIDKGIVFRFTI